MPKSSSTDRSRRSQQRKPVGHLPEPQDTNRSTDFVRILTPSNVVYLGVQLPRRSVDSPRMKPGKATSGKGRPTSLDMPRPSAPVAVTSSSTTHALPASTSTTSASPALTTASVSALLTQFNSPERGANHSRASSIASGSPSRSQTPKLGPIARLRESSDSNRAPQSPSSAELGQDTSADDSFSGVYTIPKRRSSLVGAHSDTGASPVQLGRRLRATTTSVDESLPRSRNVTFDSTADTQDSRSSPPSTPDESAERISVEYKEPEVTGEVSAGASFGTALESLKELESRDSSSAPGKARTGLGSDIPMPAEALHVLEQATKHRAEIPEADQDSSTAELRAHSEKQLISEQDKERRQSELYSFQEQEQSERSEHSVLAEQAQTDNEASQSDTSAPAVLGAPAIETLEPRLRRRRNFSASQKPADAEDEGSGKDPTQVTDGATRDTQGATEDFTGSAEDITGTTEDITDATEDVTGASGADQFDAPDAFVPESMKVVDAGNGDSSTDAPQGALGTDQSVALDALASDNLTAAHAGDGDGDKEVSSSQKISGESESIAPGASILADLTPVKADQDTTREMEGAIAAQKPSATDAEATAALAGEAPSIRSAGDDEAISEAEPKAVREQKTAQEEMTKISQPEQAKELISKPALTMATDRNASHRKPGKLTAIERQIKEDGARVSSVTGKGRPGYEVPVKKQKAPRLPINLSLNLQVTIPKLAHRKLPATTTSGDIGVNLSNKMTYNVQCLGLEISRSSPVGQLLTFGITAAIWVLWATGNW